MNTCYLQCNTANHGMPTFFQYIPEIGSRTLRLGFPSSNIFDSGQVLENPTSPLLGVLIFDLPVMAPMSIKKM